MSFGQSGTSLVYRLPKFAPAPKNLELVYTYFPVETPQFGIPPIADGLRVDPVTNHLFVVLVGRTKCLN